MSKVPIREGLFTDRVDGKLIGFKCKSCGSILPPLTITCPCCYSSDLEVLPLSGKGKLYSYTTNYMDTGCCKSPFPCGLIELKEGFRIYSVLKEKSGRPFEINIEMEMVVEKLWDKDSDEVIGYKFQPV